MSYPFSSRLEVAVGLHEFFQELAAAEEAFVIADCESRSHSEHYGELSQCNECLRVVCAAEEVVESVCEACAVRLHAPRAAVVA